MRDERKNEVHDMMPPFFLNLPDAQFNFGNGIAFYKGKEFSGTTLEKYPTGRLYRSTAYLKGKQEGRTLVKYPEGGLESARYYRKGEKERVHTGWWPNGHKRYEYHFRNGAYAGLFSEWYENGKKFKKVLYRSGQELKGFGWRDNGKVYMSFVMKDGRRYGLINARLCYSLKKEKGDY